MIALCRDRHKRVEDSEGKKSGGAEAKERTLLELLQRETDRLIRRAVSLALRLRTAPLVRNGRFEASWAVRRSCGYYDA